MLLVRVRGKRLIALRVHKLNYIYHAQLITGPTTDDLQKAAETGRRSPDRVIEDVKATVQAWRMVCEQDGYGDEREYP